MLQYERIDISDAIDVNKSDRVQSKECMISHYGILKTLIVNMNHIIIINVMIYRCLFMI